MIKKVRSSLSAKVFIITAVLMAACCSVTYFCITKFAPYIYTHDFSVIDEELPLSDFNSALLEWTNENPEKMERISEDTGRNDFQVPLNDEELSFVKLTVFLSGTENGKAIQSSYAGEPLSPYYEETLPQKTVSKNGAAAWCSLYYRFSYRISDAETVTVGERDRQIEGMINAVHAFWDNTDLENILKMSESDIVQELEKLAAKYSTDHVTITINEEQVHFERMDERRFITSP